MVLPTYETKYPGDSRPREALEASRDWLMKAVNDEFVLLKRFAADNAADEAYHDAQFEEPHASRAVHFDLAFYSVSAAWRATCVFNSQQPGNIAWSAAAWARKANSKITIEDQIHRFFNLLRTHNEIHS